MEKKSDDTGLRAQERLKYLLDATEAPDNAFMMSVAMPASVIHLGRASGLIREVLAQAKGEGGAAALREIASVIERDWARLGTQRSLILKTIRDRATAFDRMENKNETELRDQDDEELTKAVFVDGSPPGCLRPDLVHLRDRGPRSPELTKAMRVLLSYIEEAEAEEPTGVVIPTATRVDLPGPIDRDVEPAAPGTLGRRITRRIIEAIGSTGHPESAEDALTRLLAALMEAQAARGRAEGQLLQQQDAQLRQEQDVVTDLRNKVQMLCSIPNPSSTRCSTSPTR